MTVCLLSWTCYVCLFVKLDILCLFVCLFVKLDISWLFVCLTGLCYDFGGQKMATRWRWHRFKLKNMKFSLLFSVFWWIFAKFSMIFANFLLIFAKFLMTFAKFSMTFAKFSMNFAKFSMIFANFQWFLPIFRWFLEFHALTLAPKLNVRSILSVPVLQKLNILKHLRNFRKLSKRITKPLENRFSSDFDQFRWIPRCTKTKNKASVYIITHI